MKKIIFLFVFVTTCSIAVVAQSGQQEAVAAAVEQLKKAMIDGDSLQLEEIAAADLTYGHSSGHIDTRQEFIAKIASGKSDFISIDLTQQTITVTGKTAIVRHKLDAKTADNGKPGDVHLWVLLVFQKQRGGWKLLARQAVKQA